MKIACLISGLPRSFQYNIDKMMDVFEGKYVDYFLHVTKEYNDQYYNIYIYIYKSFYMHC